MKLIGNQEDFVTMFTTMNMGGLFNPVIISVKKNVISMSGRDEADTTISVQHYKNIKIEDGIDDKIVFDPVEMINAFKMFKSNEEISISIVDNAIIISNADTAEINDIITIPPIDITSVKESEFPYKINKGLPIITNKQTKEEVDFTIINATIPVKYLVELVKRANFADITPKVYKITIENNKLLGIVGQNENYQKSVTTTVNITGKGTGELLFGAGFEEMIATLSGDIILNAFPGAPVWFTSKSKNNLIYVLIAPAIEINE